MNWFSILNKVPDLVTSLRSVFSNGYKSKSVWFGAILIVLGFLQSILPELADLLGPHASLATAVIGAIVVVLRAVTSQPLEDK